MATHSTGQVIQLICTECHHHHQRAWNDERGFGYCRKCGAPLTRRQHAFDRRITTQIKHIELEK